MNIIGLTGSSGAGKGAVAGVFLSHGAKSVDADAIYHRLLETDHGLLCALEAAFGHDILTRQNGLSVLNRAKLAQTVFADKTALERLNTITIPYIRSACLAACERLAQAGCPLILLDAPTLFQTKTDTLCAATIGVVAERQTRVLRIMARDHLTREQAEARIDAQPENAFYCEKCDYIIENNGDLDALRAPVADLYAKLTHP